MKMPEQYRHDNPIIGYEPGNQEFGFFRIPHFSMKGYVFNVLASSGKEWNHLTVTVSIKGSRPTFTPSWEDLCFVKSLFFDDDEMAVQYHPKKSEYVNCHPFSLHLWSRPADDIPRPPSEMVGAKL